MRKGPWPAIPVILAAILPAGCVRPEQAAHSIVLCSEAQEEHSNFVGNFVSDTLLRPDDILKINGREIEVSGLDPDVNWFPPGFLASAKRDGETVLAFSSPARGRRGFMVNLHGPETRIRAEYLAIKWREATENTPVFIFEGNGVNTKLCETTEERVAS